MNPAHTYTLLKAITGTLLYIVLLEVVWLWSFIPEYFGITWSYPMLTAIDAALLCGFVLLFARYRLGKASPVFQRTDAAWYPLALIVGASFIFVQAPLNWIYNACAGTDYGIDFSFDGSQLWEFSQVDVLASVLFIPVAEELFFRRILQDRLQRQFHPLAAIAIAAALFATIHLPYEGIIMTDWTFDPHHAYIVFFGGLISGVLYQQSQSILPCIAMHSAWNVMVPIV